MCECSPPPLSLSNNKVISAVPCLEIWTIAFTIGVWALWNQKQEAQKGARKKLMNDKRREKTDYF